MKLQLAYVLFLSQLLVTPAFCDEQPDAAERTPIKTMEEVEWLFGTAEGPDTLHEDTPGIGKKGDEFLLRVTSKRALNGKFYLGEGTATKDGKSHELFHEIWGINPATGSLYRWSYDQKGAVFEGSVYKQGEDRVIHVIEGKVIPTDGPLKKMAETLKLSELKYSAEIVFRRVSDNQLGVTVQNVKVDGTPVPWPNAGMENVYSNVE